NSICHFYGKRPFESGDLSTNNWLMALVAFGEGWHNNHHAFPSSARQGLEWWQIDPAGYLIALLAKLGLARDVKIPSSKQMAAKRV
ncbi:MAG TPA: acyl-CoA desaturase, partial [Actinomycetota bacterium]|nr:acyl-CoA desaturase [Actinomycetota bacterium]